MPTTVDDPFINTTEHSQYIIDCKAEDKFITLAISWIDSMAELEQFQKENLKVVHEDTLQSEPTKRNSDMKSIFISLGQAAYAIPMLPVTESMVPRFHDLEKAIEQVRFHIEKNMDDLMETDYRIRQHIVQCLHEQIVTNPPEACKAHAASQLTLCYMLGFGVRRDESRCEYWNDQCEYSIDESLASIAARQPERHANPLLNILED